MASIHRSEVEATVPLLSADDYDISLPVEFQTDKEAVKLAPCRECKRPLVVTTFFAPAKAICRVCKGEEGDVATVAVPIAGHTDPAKAVNLTDCLINPHFAFAVCPVHPDDPLHEMELKSVNHNEHYGPSEHIGYKDGRPVYRQIDKGETVMHQCAHCKAVVTYSTTAQSQFKRLNEVREGKHVNGWAGDLGVRDERPPEVEPAAA